MDGSDTFRADGVRRLHEVTRRVASSTDLDEVLEAIVHGVVEGLGYGVAAIARLHGEIMVMKAVAGPEDAREEILGRRTPASILFEEYAAADHWGILRFLPHERMPPEMLDRIWISEDEPGEGTDAWHPLNALYAPLFSAEGELLGNMAVDLPPGNKVPDQQQRDLLEMFVVQAGLAISHAQRREQLGKLVRLGEALKAVALVGARGDLTATLRASVVELSEALGARQVTVRCFPDVVNDPVEHAAGHPDDGRAPAATVELIGRDLNRMAEAGQLRPRAVAPGRTDDFPHSGSALVDHMERHGWELTWVVPVGDEREVLGYLVAMPEDPVAGFDDDEVDTLDQAGRELGRLIRDARLRDRERRLVAELRDLDRYKGELIATVSHELRTPLTSIIGHTELLQDGEISPQSVDAIARNAARLDRLVGELLNYSRTQSQRGLDLKPIDLAQLGKASLELLRLQADASGVALSLGLPSTPVTVMGDGEELPRVVDNLVSNAVKYTGRGGQVSVAVRAQDGHGEVIVTDTGLGISRQDQVHLFSAFHRSTNPEALTLPGTGLGLAIARTIAETHGGEITVDSELGRGSAFTLRLPLVNGSR